MSATPIVSVRDLHRSFGNVQAVRGLSFDMYPGEVLGFIGANGSGKTATLRIMATLEPAAFVFLALILSVIGAEAGNRTVIGTNLDSGVHIFVDCYFYALPTTEYAPLNVEIHNFSGQSRQWIFDFSSPGYQGGGGFENSLHSTFAVTAENGSNEPVPLLVPLIHTENPTALCVRVRGYGVTYPEDEINFGFAGSRSRTGKPMTAYVAISDSFGTSIWGGLSKQIERDGRELLGSTVAREDLPEDWRGLSGMAGIWLTGDDMARLSAEQRTAVRTWVRTGGRLMLCGATDVPVDLRFAGFGQVRTLPLVPDLSQMRVMIEGLPLPNQQFRAGTLDPEFRGITGVKPDVGLLSAFMGLFAIIVGPVNVFIFARHRQERLFWTTPLVSLCASGLLMGLIVWKDGVGGHGARSAVVCLFPQSHEAAVVQEQISRTGMLKNSAFQIRNPVWMEQLIISPGKTQGRTLRLDGNTYSQEWFTSRATQAQRIVAVTPTRAEITLLNGAGTEKGAPPAIVSSFDTTLGTLVYTDGQHRSWWGKDIRTGEKATLQPVPVFAVRLRDGLSTIGNDSVRALARQPGNFFATSLSGGDYVATLDSIHWTDAPITYVGPVTVTP